MPSLRRIGCWQAWMRRNTPVSRFPVSFMFFPTAPRRAGTASRFPSLKELRDRMTAPKAHATFVDVGVEQPTNLAITDVELPRQIVPANDRVILRAKALATGRDYDTEILCRIDEKQAERRPIKLRAGQAEAIGPFEVRDLKPGLHRAEISLATADNLPFSAARFATFEVRGPRSVLVLSDNPGNEQFRGDADIWKLALDRGGAFHCDVMSPDRAAKLTPRELARKYQAVCLVSVAAPDPDLWDKLLKYVEDGGGSAIVPGGAELKKTFYEDKDENAAVNGLMPGRLIGLVDDKKGVPWKESTYRHPVMAPFREWGMAANVDFIQLPPKVFRYWEVEPRRNEDVIVSYADAKGRPALLERIFADRQQMRGHVLLFTTPMDGRTLSDQTEKMWNDYLETSFFFVLANKTVGYLAGDADAGTLQLPDRANRAGDSAAGAAFSDVSIARTGPDRGMPIPRSAKQGELRISQAVVPGQFTLLGGDGKWTTGFSMNVPPAECNLSKVPAEQIEALFGAGALAADGAENEPERCDPGPLEPAGGIVSVVDDYCYYWSWRWRICWRIGSTALKVPSPESRVPSRRNDMASLERFEDITAWQKARELSKAIYQVTRTGDFSRDFALKDQIRRAVVSIMSNIAEGFERGGDKEFRQFLAVAKGSAGEVKCQLYVALDAGFIDKAQFDELAALAMEVGRLLGGFMKYLAQSDLRGSKYKGTD